MSHAVDMQILNRNHTELMNNTTALLVREVLTSEPSPLMHPRDGFAVLLALRSPLSQLALLALHFGKGFFFFAEKAGILNLGAIGEVRKGLEADIDTDLFIRGGPLLWLDVNATD